MLATTKRERDGVQARRHPSDAGRFDSSNPHDIARMTSAKETAHERVAREDLLAFISACFACTGQREFYSDGRGQSISIAFLHDYVIGNYRSLYARVLACGINDHNQVEILYRLLKEGARVDPRDRAREGELIYRALERLPPQRVMRLFQRLAATRVNNRRTRAIIRRYLSAEHASVGRHHQPPKRPVTFWAVKYRRRFRTAAAHAHMPFAGELRAFFTKGWRAARFETSLFESFRKAHFAESALYELPFTIAEGLARKHAVPRDVFLRKIEPRMTAVERLRLQETTRDALGTAVTLDASRLPLVRVASYVLSLSRDERRQRRDELRAMLAASTDRGARITAARFGRVACVLDNSWSSSGSFEKRHRPLAVALAISSFVRACAAAHRSFWTHLWGKPPSNRPPSDHGLASNDRDAGGGDSGHGDSDDDRDELFVDAAGSTDLTTPLLAALVWKPDVIVIVSDGFDNDPPGVVGEVLTVVAKTKLAGAPFILHINPVFDDKSLGPKPLSPSIPTIGVRDAEDLPTALAFAELAFANGRVTLADLDRVLDARVAHFLGVTRHVESAADLDVHAPALTAEDPADG